MHTHIHRHLRRWFEPYHTHGMVMLSGVLAALLPHVYGLSFDAYLLARMPGHVVYLYDAGRENIHVPPPLRYQLRYQPGHQPEYQAGKDVKKSKAVVAILAEKNLEQHPGEPIHAAAAESSAPSVAAVRDFPAMGSAVFPVSRIPNWGAFTTPEEWSRTYEDMPAHAYVDVPAYDTDKLNVTVASLLVPERNTAELTRKLFYSTIFFGKYELDNAREFTGIHPALDLKLPLHTPLHATAGGRVLAVESDAELGLHVVIEHRHPTDGTFYSLYGHMGTAAVSKGDTVTAGQYIGTVGMTGMTTAPHVHWEILRAQGSDGSYVPYDPVIVPARTQAARRVVNPAEFVKKYGHLE
ncbi:MAG: Peptidase [Candidatus Peribacteria bacterium]|nr:Peptidase [Candidatus Peribacteria bacterium]